MNMDWDILSNSQKENEKSGAKKYALQSRNDYTIEKDKQSNSRDQHGVAYISGFQFRSVARGGAHGARAPY